MTAITGNSLEYVQIVGRGVDALDNRKEHNNSTPVTAEGLRQSIDKVKARNFESMKMLRAAGLKRASAQ
jgi:hypothetical protein